MDAYEDGARMRAFKREARQELGVVLGSAMNKAAMAPKEIVKEGLSEYFIYTIEGTETVPNAWSKRMRLFQGLRVPIRVHYRYRPMEYGDALVRLFILRNDTASRLGTTPLPDGAVRLFRDNGRDGLSYITTHHNAYVPIGQEIVLNLGPDPEVVHERIRLRTHRDNFWFRDTRGKKYFSREQGRQIRKEYPVAGWDRHDTWVERIRNYRDEPIDVEIRLAFDGHVIFTSDLDPTLHDYRSPQIAARVDASSTRDLEYAVTVRNGYRAKQNAVEIGRRN
jgi:hypothetical protein